MKRWDLHAHTTASDGMLTPEQLVHQAMKAGLSGIAVTDHDTVAGVKNARMEAAGSGLQVIAGVEISTIADGQDIHVLGYFVDVEDATFLARLREQRNGRQRRNELIVERLRELGVNIQMEEVLAKKKDHSSDTNVGRPHIADVLIDKGVVSNMNEAFDRYVGKDGQAYVITPRIRPEEAIQLIREAKGVPVLAHPGLYGADDLVHRLAEQGLAGIEVRHPDHDEEMESRYRGIASQYGLLATAGSDFHGEREGSMYHAALGTCVVDESVVKMLAERGE